jgi:hypothetical protein
VDAFDLPGGQAGELGDNGILDADIAARLPAAFVPLTLFAHSSSSIR